METDENVCSENKSVENNTFDPLCSKKDLLIAQMNKIKANNIVVEKNISDPAVGNYIDSTTRSNGEEANFCEICGEENPIFGLGKLKIHMKQHKKLHKPESIKPHRSICKKCYWCDEPYRNIKQMRKHVTKKHQKEEQFKCKSCDRSYIHPKFLHYHWQTIHQPRRLQACRYCNEIFRFSHHLEMHERAHEKPHMCELCGHRFTTSQQIDMHRKYTCKSVTYRKIPQKKCIRRFPLYNLLAST